MSKVPEYQKKSWRSWYNRNKDDEEFKQKRAETNRKAYEKRKLRLIQQSNIVVNKLDESNSNIVVNSIESNIVVNKLDETNSNIVVNPIESNIVVNPIESNIIVNLDENNSNIVVNPIESNIVVNPIESNIVVNLDEKEKRRLRQLEKDFNNEVYNLLNDGEDEKIEWDIKRGGYVKNNFASEWSKTNRIYSRSLRGINKTLFSNKKINTNLRQTKKIFK